MTAKARLLLVEDTPSIVRLYHEVLARLDVELIDADTGAGALAVLRETVPDVVLLDLGLPDSNGFIVMDIVTQLKSAAAVPIIVVSARPATVYKEAALLAGAKDYFEKPFDNDALMSAIERETGEGAQRLLKATAALPPPISND